jgi:hypothetical protein
MNATSDPTAALHGADIWTIADPHLLADDPLIWSFLSAPEKREAARLLRSEDRAAYIARRGAVRRSARLTLLKSRATRAAISGR